jgi:hypothetical protein
LKEIKWPWCYVFLTLQISLLNALSRPLPPISIARVEPQIFELLNQNWLPIIFLIQRFQVGKEVAYCKVECFKKIYFHILTCS